MMMIRYILLALAALGIASGQTTKISACSFSGSGLNDATCAGTFTSPPANNTYIVTLHATGTPDTFEWTKNGGSSSAPVNLSTSYTQLADGVLIKWAATTGHHIGDTWTITTSIDGSLKQQSFAQQGQGALLRNAQAKLQDSVSALDFNGVDSTGATDSSAGLVNCTKAASSGYCEVPPGTYKISTSVSLGNLRFIGGILQPASGQTVTLSGAISCPAAQQCFDTSAGGKIHLASTATAQVTPQNFGAKEDGATDDLSKLQATLDSVCYSSECTATILWLSGAYKTTGQLNGYSGTTPYNGLRVVCATQGYTSCTLSYQGPSNQSAIRTIGKFDIIQDIAISLDTNTGWQAGYSYDGDPAVGISTDLRMNDVFITCNFHPGDAFWGEKNDYQADQALIENSQFFQCSSGIGVYVWNPNAVAYTLVKPAIATNFIGVKTGTGTTVAIFGGEVDGNEVNFFPGIGATFVVNGIRSEESERQFFSGGPSSAVQNVTFVGDYISNFVTARPATTASGSASQNVVTLSVAGFTLGDNIVIAGAGPGAANLQVQIVSMSGPLTATLSGNLSTTVTNAAVTMDGTVQQDQFIMLTGGPFNFTGNVFGYADTTHTATFEAESAYAFQSFNFIGNAWFGIVTSPFGSHSSPAVLNLNGNTYDANVDFGGPFAMPPAAPFSPHTLAAGATTLDTTTGNYFFTRNTSISPGIIASITGQCNTGEQVVVVPQDTGGLSYTSFSNSGNILMPENIGTLAATEYQPYIFTCRSPGNPGGWSLVTPPPLAASYTYAQLVARFTAPATGLGPFTVTDSTTNTWGANVTVGGGTDIVQVWYNGVNWTVTGK